MIGHVNALLGGGSGIESPLVLPGWRIWLDPADLPASGTVTSWANLGSVGGSGVVTGGSAVVGSAPIGRAISLSSTSYINAPNPGMGGGDGEAWIVLKSVGGGTGIWWLGDGRGGAELSLYPWDGDGRIYDSAGCAAAQRQSFTPTLSITDWRVYRVAHAAASGWRAWLDGSLQATVTGLTRSWSAPTIGAGTPSTLRPPIALFGLRDRESTPAEAAQIATWIKTTTGVGA